MLRDGTGMLEQSLTDSGIGTVDRKDQKLPQAHLTEVGFILTILGKPEQLCCKVLSFCWALSETQDREGCFSGSFSLAPPAQYLVATPLCKSVPFSSTGLLVPTAP